MAGVLRINIWFSLPVPKIKFDPPTQGKSALVEFVSTPRKIIIPQGNSVPTLGLYMGHKNPSGWVMIFFYTPK